jgi:hypothetical protein
MDSLAIYLEDLEARIEEEEERRLYEAWRAFADGTGQQEPFAAPRRRPAPPRVEWPQVNMNDALTDDGQMLLREFKMCSDLLAGGSGSLMSVRANYGVGILPTVLGAEVFVMPRTADCQPNARPLPGAGEAACRLMEGPPPPLTGGWGESVFRIGEKIREIRARYPKIGRWVRVDHPDCQGPMDLCELLWGSGLFEALYDEPERVHAFLSWLTEFYTRFMEAWFSMMPNEDGYHCYFGRLHKGRITVRDDSAMNLSPAMFEEFIFPYDNRLLRRFTGMVHFCGRGDHYIARLSELENLYAVDLSQPHLNDMEQILRNTVDKGINLHTGPGDYLGRAAGHNLRRLSV